jgi:hypothetical protein
MTVSTDLHYDVDQMTAFLRLIMRGDVHEIAVFDPVGADGTGINLFTGDPEEAIHHIQSIPAGAYRTAYIRPNPVGRARTKGFGPIRKAEAQEPHSAATWKDVSRLRFIQLDVDADKDDGRKAATQSQHADSIRRRDRLRSWLFTQYGIEASYIGDTGKGGNLLIAVDLPNDAEHRRLVKTIFRTINRELAAEGISIDEKVSDAARFVGIAGTPNAKEERQDAMYPWRMRRGEVYPDVPATSIDALYDLAAPSLHRTQATPSGPRRNITLARDEQQSIITMIAPYWTDGVRHTTGQGVAGLLWHRGIGYEQARLIISTLSQNDNKPDDRLASLDRAYERGAAGETVEYFGTLTEVMGEDGLKEVGRLLRSIERAHGPTLTASGQRPPDPASNADPRTEERDDEAENSQEPAGPPYSDSMFAVRWNVHHRYDEPKMTKDGELVGGGWKPIANFAAYVIADAIYPEDDTLNYSEVILQDSKGRTHGPKRIPAVKFRRPDDWLGLFGSWPRVYPGVTSPVLLNAIQSASGFAPIVTVWDRMGWTASGHFLSASGAMTPEGLDDSVRVEPGGRLEGIVLQDPGDIDPLRDAVRSILSMGEIAQTPAGDVAVSAMLAAALRAPLIPAKRANFSITLVGVTGSVKSGLAGLAASLYGPSFTYDHLHGSWQSTTNSLVDLISRPRHTMIVIDDYLEKETGSGVAGRRAIDRDTLIRHQGNGSTRSRLRSDATRNDGKDPAVVLVSTQETLGSYLDESEIGRQLIVPMQKGDISIDRVKGLART